jgi:hypothetical protein
MEAVSGSQDRVLPLFAACESGGEGFEDGVDTGVPMSGKETMSRIIALRELLNHFRLVAEGQSQA